MRVRVCECECECVCVCTRTSAGGVAALQCRRRDDVGMDTELCLEMESGRRWRGRGGGGLSVMRKKTNEEEGRDRPTRLDMEREMRVMWRMVE